MTKLTNNVRSDIVLRAMKHRFTDDEKFVREMKNELAGMIYAEAFTKKDREKMCSLPDGWLPTTSVILANIQGMHVSLCTDRRFIVPANKRNDYLGSFAAGTAVANKWSDIINIESELKRKRDEVRATMNAVLRSVNTVKQLLVAWPECERFLHGLIRVPASVPAIPVDNLNKMLGLGVENGNE